MLLIEDLLNFILYFIQEIFENPLFRNFFFIMIIGWVIWTLRRLLYSF